MFQRELTVRGRAGSTYLARTIAAVSAVVMLASILGSSALSPASVAGAGRHLFEVILQFLFVFAVFEGVRCTAFGIVGERKGGTLGLLFLTSMRGHDVLLGKVGGGMASTLSTLMVFSPLIAVPMLLGGVDLVTLLAGVSVLLSGMLVSMACGALASATSSSAMGSLTKAFALAAVFTFAPVLLAWMAGVVGPPAPMIFGSMSPAVALMAVVESSPKAPLTWVFWFGQGGVLLIAGALMASAGAALRRNWAAEAFSPSGRRTVKQVNIDDLLHGLGKRFASLQRLVPAPANPLSRSLAARLGLNRWLPVFALTAVVSSLLHAFTLETQDSQTHWITKTILYFGFSLLFAYVSVETLSEAKRSGEMEILMTTPLPDGKLTAALWRLFRRLIGWTVAAELGGLMVGVGMIIGFGWRSSHVQLTNLMDELVQAPLMLALSALNYCAMAWLGMWVGLRAKSTGRGVTTVFVLAAVVPVIASVALQIIAVSLFSISIHLKALEYLVTAVWWIALLLWSRSQLRRHFRDAVTR